MINISIVLSLIVLHFLYDFVLQTDWEAKNKSISNKALFSHVIKYTLGLICYVFGFMIMKGFAIGYILWVVINSIAHFITDYFTSRINKKFWEAGDTHNFFVWVGMDQIIHYFTLFITWVILI